MQILVSGSSGLIGSALSSLAEKHNHTVKRLVRKKALANDNNIYWNIEKQTLDAEALTSVDAVVHLAGENIASRWTPEQKRKIRDSRIISTNLLSKTLAEMSEPPWVFVCASAIGYYGDRGAEVLNEESSVGSGFLSQVCREWEGATHSASEKGIRVVNIRTGVILSDKGGALRKMLLPFKMGFGGIVGNGEQYWSWLSVDDAVNAILHIINTKSLTGPVNLVGPNPCTNKEFTKTLGKVLSRPTLFPMPAFAARLIFGEMAEELLLSSARVEPKKLTSSNYDFLYPDLDTCLEHILK